jgi:hypothetical protein
VEIIMKDVKPSLTISCPSSECPDCEAGTSILQTSSATSPIYKSCAADATIGKQERKDGSALKYDNSKPPMDLLSRKALVELAKVMEFGRVKYAAHNWRKGMAWSRVIAALLRHALAYSDGETTDPETGLSHAAHVMACAMFLVEYEQTHIELDDRYGKENK